MEMTYEAVFDYGVTIIVEKSPVGYTNYKSYFDGVDSFIMQIWVDGIDKLDVDKSINAMADGGSTVGKAIPPKGKDKGWQKFNGAVKLAGDIKTKVALGNSI
jgi:hypothetical protein